MKPFVYNFTIPRATTFELPVVWKSGGAVVDLAGWNAKLQVRKDFGETAVITLTDGSEENGIVIIDADGRLTFYFSATASNIPAGVYRYDVLLSAGDVQKRLMQGKIDFTDKITA